MLDSLFRRITRSAPTVRAVMQSTFRTNRLFAAFAAASQERHPSLRSFVPVSLEADTRCAGCHSIALDRGFFTLSEKT